MKVSLELTDSQIDEIAGRVAALVAGNVPVAVPARRTPYKVAEAAELLGVSSDTIYRMVAAGRLGRVPGSAVVRIPAVEMERVLAGQSGDGGQGVAL